MLNKQSATIAGRVAVGLGHCRPVLPVETFAHHQFCFSFLRREDPIFHLIPWKSPAKNAFALYKAAKIDEDN